MEFYVKNKGIQAKKGDYLIVEKGVKHAFRNPTAKIAKIYNTHEPALKMEEYFEDVLKLYLGKKQKNSYHQHEKPIYLDSFWRVNAKLSKRNYSYKST